MICQLFNIPWFVWTMLMVDCLHTLDLGVTQDMIGCLFYYCIMNTKMFAGRSKIDRLNELWSRIKQYYKDANPPKQLSNLTWNMVRQESKRPRLRAKATETRHLVAFAYDLACELASFEDTTHCHTIANAMKALFGLYSCFGTTPFPKEDAAKYT